MKKEDKDSGLRAILGTASEKRADTQKLRDANGSPSFPFVGSGGVPAKESSFSGNFLFPQPRR